MSSIKVSISTNEEGMNLNFNIVIKEQNTMLITIKNSLKTLLLRKLHLNYCKSKVHLFKILTYNLQWHQCQKMDSYHYFNPSKNILRLNYVDFIY